MTTEPDFKALTSEELKAAIKKRNAEFAAMPPALKRVTIAKDVIAWLDAKKLVARSGTYLSSKSIRNCDTEDAQTALLATDVSCNVCALGAVFACAVGRANEIATNDFRGYNSQHSMHNYLSPYFSNEQLYLIESAFECSSSFYDNIKDPDYAVADRAEEFGLKYSESDVVDEENSDPENDLIEYLEPSKTMQEPRMRAIMQNIIDNNGEFKP